MLSRVHWFLWNLPTNVKRAYRLYYDYEYHNYLLVRFPFGKLKPVDLFVIIRTSRRCWRCMYYHFYFNYFEYFSEKTSSMLAKKVEFTYLKMWKAEFDEKERNI